jgi:GNAT superfamily N-acetyltransferase
MHVRPVDMTDDHDLRVWFDTQDAVLRHDWEDAPLDSFAEWLARFRNPNPTSRFALLLAEDGGQVRGGGQVEFPLRDNLTLAEAFVTVLPDARRRGAGRAIWAGIVAEARQNGRTSIISGVVVPYDPQAPRPAGIAFAEACGLTYRHEEVRRRLQLPVPDELLEKLLADTEPYRADYELVHYEGATPEEYAERYARIVPRLATEAPSGELKFEAPVYDVDRLRNGEALHLSTGLRLFTTIALAPDGEIAGHTRLAVPSAEDQPERAYQWATLVVPEHRGHRLGLALKARNHLGLQDAMPDIDRTMNTWNASTNTWMISTNEALGYRPVDRFAEFQGDI